MTTIWERYFLKEFIKTCLFFLLGFYGLYILIDYSSHAASFHHHHVQFQWREVVVYYACEFVKRLEVLLPFAILIALIRTLCSLMAHNELVALMSSGISLQRLMRPFVLVGLAFTGLMYMNTEFFLPIALKDLKHIDNSRSREKHKKYYDASVQHIVLEDATTIIFQSYDPVQKRFFDAYWIRNIDEIYRIKYLYPHSDPPSFVPIGYFVDLLQRNGKGELIAQASYTSKTFPDIHFNQQTLFETITLPEELSLSDLHKKIPNHEKELTEKESLVLSAFYRKLALPWFCFLAIIGAAPFCLQFVRNLPVFFIYAGSLFSLVIVYLVMDASVLLGKRQVLSPFLAIWPPFLLFFSYFIWRFAKLK